MIVCHCTIVSDKEIMEAIKQGAFTIKDISKLTNACLYCKGCQGLIEKILKENRGMM